MFDPIESKELGNFFRSAIKFFVAVVALFILAHVIIARLPHTTDVFLTQHAAGDLRAAAQGAFVVVEDVRVLGHKEEESVPAETPPPPVSAHAYIVADADSGQVFAEKNADNIRPVASLSKLVTALAASSENPTIIVHERATRASGNGAGLIVGELLPLETLLYPLLLESANDAAYALAFHYGDASFRSMMNRSANNANMTRSRFVEPSGLSQDNVSTARDLLRLVTHIRKERPFIFEITTRDRKEVQSFTAEGAEKRSFVSRNILELRAMEGFAGGKSGFTSAAGKTLLTLFDVTRPHGETQTVAIIVLGANDSTRDTLSLFSWFRNFSR
jgi:D-alanyl-D-alanine carboxypeptidase